VRVHVHKYSRFTPHRIPRKEFYIYDLRISSNNNIFLFWLVIVESTSSKDRKIPRHGCQFEAMTLRSPYADLSQTESLRLPGRKGWERGFLVPSEFFSRQTTTVSVRDTFRDSTRAVPRGAESLKSS
jgi:hypothetical protein